MEREHKAFSYARYDGFVHATDGVCYEKGTKL